MSASTSQPKKKRKLSSKKKNQNKKKAKLQVHSESQPSVSDKNASKQQSSHKKLKAKLLQQMQRPSNQLMEKRKESTSNSQHQNAQKKKKNSLKAKLRQQQQRNTTPNSISSEIPGNGRKKRKKKKKNGGGTSILESKAQVAQPRNPSQQKQPQPKSKAPKKKLSALQAKMKEKLEGAQFRWLNEKLYTTTGEEAFQMFQDAPDDFYAYHTGFANQAKKWPINPVDIFAKFLKKHPKLVVGDFGCGEAKLAASVRNKVHSFDLVAVNESVTACDITNVPLEDGTLDIAIFSLSLMGSNFLEFLREAHRTLKPGGLLKIAEVVSRFDVDRSAQGQRVSETGLQSFIDTVCLLGFDFIKKNIQNSIFVFVDFRRQAGNRTFDLESALRAAQHRAVLKPCVYKKR